MKHRPSKALAVGIWRRVWATVAPASWASAPEPVKPRSIDITLRQAWELVEFFGGHDCEVTVSEGPGHAGPGLYAYCTEYPEEGAWHLGRTEVDESLAIGARLSMPGKTAESVLREMLDMAKTGDADLDESWAGVMADAAAVLARRPLEFVDVVLDGAPGPDSGRFVELHDSAGKGLKYGEWLQSADGYSVLRIPIVKVEPPTAFGEYETLEHRHLNRYRVERDGWNFKIKCGDGDRTLHSTKFPVDADTIARELLTAFRDGLWIGCKRVGAPVAPMTATEILRRRGVEAGKE